ncbi:fatty acid--CoA ligase family protein [Longimicrobium sp.]|uniref:class I adenylate-forming enzyme family protein n=1 Tax=Longimicrobium sp. TaxID=2029185 RepID=UPI002E349F86|nr:fatty acid--CoA ligase family protein [Longimicrobium sp.]HEX6042036.1 fatty acid--CoA ligase family protein [Longimicrobium sp.]
MNPDTLIGALHGAFGQWADRPALTWAGRHTTYAELGAAVRRTAAAYRALGIGPGDRVVCCVSNRPELFTALGAAWGAGAVHVCADHQLTGPELSRVMDLTGAAALVWEPPADAPDPFFALRTVRARHPGLRVLLVGGLPAPEGCLAFDGLSAPPRSGPAGPAGPAAEDPALVFISSGTTGAPKATLGYHGNLAQRWRRLAGWLRFGEQDVHLAHLPLSHGFGMMMAMGALLSGGRLVLLDPFTAAEALRLVRAEGVTVLNGAPAHFTLVLSRLEARGGDVDTLRLAVGTAAAFPLELVRGIWDRLGAEFMYMYGSSEGVGVATTDRDDIARGSVGRPAPGAVRVVDAEGRPLPAGAVGELAFSRRVYPVRYWGAAAPDEEEWYRSGDLGRLDEAGRLYVHGRLKHQIDRGGLKVDPLEVESALLRLPSVADAAVIGVPNPVLGETVCACVVPAPGRAPELEAVRAALAGELAPYKLPQALCLLDAIPRTRIGKVDLPALRAAAAAGPALAGAG